MDILDRSRKFENLHIVFWLIKDSCWMLELKWLGTLMVLPALAMALYITYFTRKTMEYYINLAIFCWITANSYWMLMEFFNDEKHKIFAGIPFALGFVFVFIFYYKTYVEGRKLRKI